MAKDKPKTGAVTEKGIQPRKGQTDVGQASVQKQVDEENAKGLAGIEVDPTPNRNYAVEGVTSGAPTPETDPEAARTAREATGLGKSGIEAQADLGKSKK